jgi:TRAP-type transport system periplasmic protein
MPTRRLSRTGFLGALGAPVNLAFAAPAAAADTYTLRLSQPNPTASVLGRIAVRFAVNVRRRSRGQLNIEVYSNGQPVTQGEMVGALTSGVIDIGMLSSALLEPLFPQCQVFDMPFLFRDAAATLRVLDGPIGSEFFAAFESKGIAGLGWGIYGLKQLESTNKPIVVPEDMKGMRIRILGGAVNVATYQALGALPVTIDLSEAFTALSQHVIDALDVNLDGFTTGKYYTVCKHVAMTNHVASIIPMLGSKRKIDALPVPLQTILRQEAKAVVPVWRALAAQEIAADVEFLKQNGVTFTEVQYAAFRKAVEPVYAQYQAKIGADLLERIARAASPSGRR